MQKRIEFHHNKGIDMLKVGCALPNSANICLHKSTDSKFYPFTEWNKDCLRRYEKIWLAVLLLSLHVRRWWVKLIYPNHQTCANHLLVSKLVSFIPTRYANQCQLDCMRDGGTILKLRDSQLARTNLAPLRKWFCHNINEVSQIAKLRVMSILVDKRRLIVSV